MAGMSESFEHLATFVALAMAYERRLQMMDRDRVLVIAAVIASERQLESFAGFLRHKVLEHNQGHMLKHYETVFDAVCDPDFLVFLKQIRRRFPIEKVESQLDEFGELDRIPTLGDRPEFETLATMVNTDPHWIRKTFSVAP